MNNTNNTKNKEGLNIQYFIHNPEFTEVKKIISSITAENSTNAKDIVVIAPNVFIANRLADFLNYEKHKEQKNFKFYTWESIDFNSFFDKKIKIDEKGELETTHTNKFQSNIVPEILKNENYTNPLLKFYKAVMEDKDAQELVKNRILNLQIILSQKKSNQFKDNKETTPDGGGSYDYEELEERLNEYKQKSFQVYFTELLKQNGLWGKENISQEDIKNNKAFKYLDMLCEDIQNDLELLNQKNIFSKEDKDRFVEILNNTLSEIKQNLIELLKDANTDEKRTQWLIGITIIAVLVGAIVTLATLRTRTIAVAASLGGLLADVLFASNDIIDYKKELENLEASRFYLPFAVPIMKALFEDISYISALCCPQLYSCMIFYDDKFLDLSAINFLYFFNSKMPQKDFAYQCHNSYLIMGTYNQKSKNEIINDFKEGKKQKIEDISSIFTFNPNIKLPTEEYSCTLELYEHLDKDFKDFVFIEQPQFLSRALAKLIKNDSSKPNLSAKQPKNYLLITQAPFITMANLSESITKEIFSTYIERPEAPKDKTQIDYSEYDLKQDNSEKFVLQLSPFVKESAGYAQEFKAWFSQDIEARKEVKKGDEAKIQIFKEVASNFLSKEYKKGIKEAEEYARKRQEALYKSILNNLTLTNFNKNNSTTFEYLPIEIILQIALILASAKIQKITLSIYPSLNASLEEKDIQLMFDYRPPLDDHSNDIILSNYPNEHNINLENLSDFFYEIVIGKIDLEKLNNQLKIGDIDINLNEGYKSVDKFILDHIIPKEELDNTYKEVDFERLRLEILAKAYEDFIASIVPFADGFNKALTKLALIFACTSVVLIAKNLFTDLKIVAKEIVKSFHPSLALLIACAEDFTTLKNSAKGNVKFSQFKIYRNYKSITYTNTIQRKTLFKYVILEEKIVYTQTEKALKDLGFHQRMQFFEAAKAAKGLGSSVGISAASEIAKCIAKNIFSSNTQILLAEYESIFFLNLEKYNRPYALIRDEFLSYPLPIYSNFISYNFSKALFGSRLTTGALEFFPNIIIYSSTERKTKNSKSSQVECIREMMVNKLLAYIVLDELREGYDDKCFMQKMLKRHITKDEIMKQYSLDKDFINTNPNLPERNTKLTLINNFHTEDEKVALKAYNELIYILSEVIDGKLNAQGKKILSCLKIIGKNNLKALYTGINDDKKNEEVVLESSRNDTKIQDTQDNKTPKVRPPFIGRLATTIIVENGGFSNE